MKIINCTRYDSHLIRHVFHTVHARTAKVRGRYPQWHKVETKVVYSRSYYTGCAWIETNSITIRVPKLRISLRWTAALFEHELLHLYGCEHSEIGRFVTITHARRYRDIV